MHQGVWFQGVYIGTVPLLLCRMLNAESLHITWPCLRKLSLHVASKQNTNDKVCGTAENTEFPSKGWRKEEAHFDYRDRQASIWESVSLFSLSYFIYWYFKLEEQYHVEGPANSQSNSIDFDEYGIGIWMPSTGIVITSKYQWHWKASQEGCTWSSGWSSVYSRAYNGPSTVNVQPHEYGEEITTPKGFVWPWNSDKTRLIEIPPTQEHRKSTTYR